MRTSSDVVLVARESKEGCTGRSARIWS